MTSSWFIWVGLGLLAAIVLRVVPMAPKRRAIMAAVIGVLLGTAWMLTLVSLFYETGEVTLGPLAPFLLGLIALILMVKRAVWLSKRSPRATK
jgi:cytochrome c oxidase assembly factor CtaG